MAIPLLIPLVVTGGAFIGSLFNTSVQPSPIVTPEESTLGSVANVAKIALYAGGAIVAYKIIKKL